MEVWYCRACREENFGESRFCEACGGNREEVASPTPPPPRQRWIQSLLGSSGASPEPEAREAAPPQRAVAPPSQAWPVPSGGSTTPAREKASGNQRLPSHSPFRQAESKEADDLEEDPRTGRHHARKKVRMRFLHMGERLKGLFTRENYREVLTDRRHPATTMIIAFVAWGIFRMVGFAPLMILLRLLAFLAGPFGLVVVLAVAYVYGRYRREIDARVATMRRRARAFRAVTVEAARSMGWLGRAVGWLRRGTATPEKESRGASRAPSQGTPVKGASVRILDEDDEG